MRLVTDTENVRLSPAERVKALKEILPVARAEEKWAVLAGLAKLPTPAPSPSRCTMLDDPATRAEAVQAVTQIASGLASVAARTRPRWLWRTFSPRPPGLPSVRRRSRPSGRSTRPAGAAFVRGLPPRQEWTGRSGAKAWPSRTSTGTAVSISPRGISFILGPDWKPQPMLAAPKEYEPEGYSDEFLCFAEDIDRDGWTDLIVVGLPRGEDPLAAEPRPARRAVERVPGHREDRQREPGMGRCG